MLLELLFRLLHHTRYAHMCIYIYIYVFNIYIYMNSPQWRGYEACPESKDTKVLNMYNIFNFQKRHCE
jgi:hypothetical protein